MIVLIVISQLEVVYEIKESQISGSFLSPKTTNERGEVMPKARNPDADKAEALFHKGMKLINIAREEYSVGNCPALEEFL